MIECGLKEKNIRLLGRLDETQNPLCLDWTGSGFEVNFQGTQLWAELEATCESPDMWAAVAVDGCPIARFMVEPGRRWYPLGRWNAPWGEMETPPSRVVTLMKETQCMPFAPEATVKVHGLRHDGALLPLPDPALRVEFIGDSLTSAEGAMAPKDNQEWIPMWFTAFGNYSFHVCNALKAERRVISQSGQGVAWNFMYDPAGNLADDYELTVGALKGEAAEARGCRKIYDFAAWPADAVLIRLLSNDVGGMRRADKVEEMTEPLTGKCVDFIKKVRRCNPKAHIVWVLPPSDNLPEIAVEAVKRCQAEGIEKLSCLALPDYGPEELGARNHPNAAYNEKIGKITAEYLRELMGIDAKE